VNAPSSSNGAEALDDRPIESGESLRPDREELLTLIRSVAREGAGTPQFPRYEVLEPIGRGGMAVVYRARQTGLGREVALKQLLAEQAPTRKKMLEEAQVNALLDHPGIVPVYDLLETDRGDVALVMRLIRGTSWKALLYPADPAARRDLDFHIGVLLAVSNAVAFAHDKGLSHNDLKPSNVMVGPFGEVLVVDWGLAFDIRDAPPDNSSVAPHKSTLKAPSGTPAYWAPELAKGRGSDIGPWTDVYLMGAILYELAAGQPPHRGGSLFTTIKEALVSDPPPLKPGAPPGLEAICRKAMAPAPQDRYRTVAAFQDALRDFLKHRESLTIATGAEKTLTASLADAAALAGGGSGSAERSRVYAGFSEAASGFRQALVLWPENPEAREGERRASLSLAKLALENGDLGLAEVQASKLSPGDPEGRAITERIRAANAARSRGVKSARIMRRALIAATVAIVAGLAGGLLAIRAEQRRTEANAALARSRLADVRRLADMKLVVDYTAEAGALWPSLPEKVPAMEAWLGRARALAGRLDGHRAHLAELRRRDAPEPAPRFSSAEEQWEHDALVDLVAGLETFEKATIPAVERRVSFAQTVREKTIALPAAAWRGAIESIASPSECPLYGGLRITPQLGLIPLGRDPASGLWEFAHLESGEVPARGPDGSLALTEQSGVVLVLLPGATFSMGTMPPDREHPPGSPNVDPDARAPERPIHAVTLEPFFLAKHELTQGQWQRAAGVNPSAYPAGATIGKRLHTRLHPVEQIGWKEASSTLARLGLGLPTEAQWEYAARAGTTSIYWTGAIKETLQGAVNLADRYCKENGGPGSWQFEMWLDDGYVAHAPVGSYRANAFGLHDMAGNVWEFVLDRYGGYELPVSAGSGERQVPTDTPRVFRGGGFRSNAVHARSADRYGLYAPDYRGFDVGVRAARVLDR
jgi:formylglycine-generating enzyme required for sulfatase activity/tRNA A-37 threonylcarbamoyl transferase component Bud32